MTGLHTLYLYNNKIDAVEAGAFAKNTKLFSLSLYVDRFCLSRIAVVITPIPLTGGVDRQSTRREHANSTCLSNPGSD